MQPMLKSYSQQGYPFYGQPVNHYPNFKTAPYTAPGPSTVPPAFGQQYIPHPQNAAYIVQPSVEGSSTSRMPRPKHLTLRSALKRSDSTAAEPLTRQRTTSGTKQDDAPLTRQRTRSQSRSTQPYFSYHIFVTFKGTNELIVENLMAPNAISELKQEIWPIWKSGVTSEETRGTLWRAIFANHPWSSSGKDSLAAWEIVAKLFWLLAARGYRYCASVHTGTSNPRLVFVMTLPEHGADFVLAHFSSIGDRLSVINPPPEIADTLADNLTKIMPRMTVSDISTDDEVLSIEVKPHNYGAAGPDKTELISHVLKVFQDMGYILQTTIPMARRGVLGLRYKSRKEMWVFKGNKSNY